MSEQVTGVVKFFDTDRGFGFVTIDDQSDIFIHVTGLQPGQNYPNPGDRVSLEIGAGQKGPMGTNIVITESNPNPPPQQRPRPPRNDGPRDGRGPRDDHSRGGRGRDGGR